MSATSDAAAALNRLMLERVITRFETNFESVRQMGSAPEVHVWTKGGDELARARARKRVRETLYPFLKAAVTVHSEPPIQRDTCGTD